MAAFESQFVTGRDPGPPSMLDTFETTAAHWGGLIGRRYGEPIASREPLGLDHLKDLI